MAALLSTAAPMEAIADGPRAHARFRPPPPQRGGRGPAALVSDRGEPWGSATFAAVVQGSS
jgi:hypothetical protein